VGVAWHTLRAAIWYLQVELNRRTLTTPEYRQGWISADARKNCHWMFRRPSARTDWDCHVVADKDDQSRGAQSGGRDY
jgi:hypothetical protein